jgi:hypothetical protein
LIYEALPVLYLFRFPMRLLALATVRPWPSAASGCRECGASRVAGPAGSIEPDGRARGGGPRLPHSAGLAGAALFGLLMLQSVWDALG